MLKKEHVGYFGLHDVYRYNVVRCLDGVLRLRYSNRITCFGKMIEENQNFLDIIILSGKHPVIRQHQVY
jgi:hypothetical protein